MSFKDSSIMPVIAVDDIERASSFYRDKLGLDVRPLGDTPDSVVVDCGSNGYLLLYKTTYRRGETTVASFLVSDVKSSVRELRERGVQFEEYDIPGVKTEDGVATYGDSMETAWFKDSEGNVLAVSTDISQSLRKAA
jgi:hypothetical protein